MTDPSWGSVSGGAWDVVSGEYSSQINSMAEGRQLAPMLPPASRSHRIMWWLVSVAAVFVGLFAGATGLIAGMTVVALDRANWFGGSIMDGNWDSGRAPAWVEQPFVRSGEAVEFVGGGHGLTPEAGLADAQRDMMETLFKHLQWSVQRRAQFDLALPMPALLSEAELDQSIRAFERTFGSGAAPRRVDGAVRRGQDDVFVAAKYAMTSDAWNAAATYYSSTVDFRGITVAPVYPTLVPTVGQDVSVVVVATSPWMRQARPGDVVVAVGERPVHSLDSFQASVLDAWGATDFGEAMTLRVRRGNQEHDVAFAKVRR